MSRELIRRDSLWWGRSEKIKVCDGLQQFWRDMWKLSRENTWYTWFLDTTLEMPRQSSSDVQVKIRIQDHPRTSKYSIDSSSRIPHGRTVWWVECCQASPWSGTVKLLLGAEHWGIDELPTTNLLVLNGCCRVHDFGIQVVIWVKMGRSVAPQIAFIDFYFIWAGQAVFQQWL